MHLSHHSVTHQQKRVRHYVGNTDSHALFNLLTSPQLLDSVEELLPEHRERLYPQTETLSMFLSQALSADGSCDAGVKRMIGGLESGKTDTGAYCKARMRLPLPMVSTLTDSVGLTKPKKKPDWMSQEDYDQAPDRLKVREMKAGGKIMVTTMLCSKEASKETLKSLFRDRWNA